MTTYGASEILPLLGPGCTVLGDTGRLAIGRAASVGSAGRDAVTWVRGDHPRAQALLDATRAGLIVCPPSLDPATALAGGACVAVAPIPKVAFSRLVAALLGPPPPPPGIHPTAVIHPEAEIGEGVHVGPFAVLGRCAIGDGSVLHARCTLHDGTRVGRTVTVGAAAVLGGPGFSYEWDEAGRPVHFPHLGGVVLEDDVVLHDSVTIARGSLQDTIVRRGAALDSLVFVAHNATVGEGTIIAAQAVLGGSCVLGARCWLGLGAIIRDGATVGDDSFVGMGAVVARDLPPGSRVMGNPALPVDEAKARLAVLRRLASGEPPAAS